MFCGKSAVVKFSRESFGYLLIYLIISVISCYENQYVMILFSQVPLAYIDIQNGFDADLCNCH